ncbi:MAG: hypothetical protein Q4D71_01895 [Oscillospiraceae bacterium]|nr:hypothetical protein [Oscillospiraceae bacterium]
MRKVEISGTLSNTALRANEYFRQSWKQKEISFDDLDSVYFRKRRLKASIQQMLDAINGRTIEIRALTTDFHGLPSEEGVHTFVNDLMDSLELYMQYKLSDVPYPFRDLQSPGMDVMSPELRSFFRSFLYLSVIRFMYTDADLSDLIEYAAEVPMYISYREFLSSYYEQLYPSHHHARQLTRENGSNTEGGRPMDRPDLLDVSARNNWLTQVRSTQSAYYGLSNVPRFSNRIMQFRYLAHASEEEIRQMLDDLKERSVDVPAEWVNEYKELTESLRDTDLYGSVSPTGWESGLLERSISDFLHHPFYANSPEMFTDSVAGMIDVYTVRGGGMAITDPDSFYKIFDNIKKIERFSLDHLSPFKKESL